MIYTIRRDLVAGSLFLLMGLLLVYVLIPIGITIPKNVSQSALSPAFWPIIIAWIAVGSSAMLIFETLVLPRICEEEVATQHEFSLTPLRAAMNVVILACALFAFYVGLDSAGMVGGSIVLLFGMMLFFGERNFGIVALLSLFVPIALFGFFRYVASVPIPLGIFS